ncbi:MAG: hypothetical protein ACYTX0_51430, partial [Nostoc sp.]
DEYLKKEEGGLEAHALNPKNRINLLQKYLNRQGIKPLVNSKTPFKPTKNTVISWFKPTRAIRKGNLFPGGCSTFARGLIIS